jgi:hypothetical protein
LAGQGRAPAGRAGEVLAVLQIAATAVNLAQKLIDFIKSHQGIEKVKEIEVEIDGERVPAGSLTPDRRNQARRRTRPGNLNQAGGAVTGSGS